MKRKLLGILTGISVMVLTTGSVYGAAVGYVTARPATAVATTPSEDVFSLAGGSLKFILLDHDEEGFFVSAKDYYGTYFFDAGGDGKFDIENPNNVAYWLNNDFLRDGGYMYNDNTNDAKFELPEQIKAHLVERDWLCEAGYYTSDYSEDYYVRAKIALMSVTEWKKYNAKVGYADDTNMTNYYWLRSVNGTTLPGDAAPVMVINSGGQANFGKIRNAYGIKPVFYLDREFFLEEKLEISTMGSNVKKILRDAFKKEEFQSIYNKIEIEELYKPLPPQAKQVSVTGISQAGKVLTGSYVYYSPENEEEAETEYRWLRSKNINGPFSIIRGENELEYRIRPIDQGYYILFEVIPKSKTKIGTAVKSAVKSTPAEEGFMPYSENVYIDGRAITGEKLIARYSYVDGNDDIEEGTLIKWQSSEDGIKFTDIPDATGMNYVISKELEGKYIRFIVWVKSQDDESYGEPTSSDIIGSVKLKPEISSVEISEENGSVKLLSVTSEKDIICWETEITDGKYLIASVGGNEYFPNGTEKSIRARVYPVSDEGIMGDGVSSNVITLQPASVNAINGEKVKKVSGNGIITVKSSKPDYAYSMIIKLKCDGVNIESVESQGYKAMISKKDTDVVIVLTKTAIAGVFTGDELCKLNTSGNGSVEIISTEGSYKEGNETIKTTPELIIE